MQYDDYATLASSVQALPAGMPFHHAIVAALAERRHDLDHALARLARDQATALADAAARLVVALRAGGKVLVAGNGGSAAEAQHFAAELVGRFKRERVAFAALALTTDTSALTAIANDYGYPEVFARQLQGLGRAGDVFVAFSTSGTSANLLRAATVARALGIAVIAVTGAQASPLARAADVAVRVPLADTATIQEIHMVVTHLLCDIVEREMQAGMVPEVEA